MQSLNLVLKNDLSELQRLTDAVHGFLKDDPPQPDSLAALDLVCEELLVNIINYAFPEGGEHLINFELERQGQNLKIGFSDDGVEFNLLAAADPDLALPLEERYPGGLGIYLVKKAAERLAYRREQGRNVLEVWLRS